MRDTFATLVEELREKAEEAAEEANDGNAALSKVINVKPARPQDMIEWEAADVIEELSDALSNISDGNSDPKSIADKVFDPTERAKRLLNR
ncbi:hypothetical protein [Roseixanthobacter glucoisosaccharinicivorans]|uniref:hypothetical protein n=1 Tax=Roseixanthobacter glucoisosaccharinicivorans TaxID=3119923 RepID=UPI003729352F